MARNLYDISLLELTELVTTWGQPGYRAKQIWHWLYKQLATDPTQMTNLSRELIERLSIETTIGGLETIAVQRSSDGQTEKRLFKLADGETIESVLMSYRERHTVCVSSQVGCGFGCVFCATGQMGLKRDLTPGEIVAQVIEFERQLRLGGSKVSNIVYMGMGEPLHNYEATMESIRRLNDPSGLDYGARRITVSTVGLPNEIRKLAGEKIKIGLAISLHSTTDAERRRIIPAARRWSIAEVLKAGREYTERTGRRLSFEWALIQGANDTPEEAHALGRLVQGMLCHVNLIPLNPTDRYSGLASGRERVERFQQILSEYGIPNTVRLWRGLDIQAGCGQLKQKSSVV
ncbi:MAG: 23S rRNA (adenine(2503)-C(2))-methyltransferase RlmN [Anaerolineales bacterium]|nr:23S rRNA (adenine(2503)-C(2))-methyltransferase RlmN [Anaerolineales bacterium]